MVLKHGCAGTSELKDMQAVNDEEENQVPAPYPSPTLSPLLPYSISYALPNTNPHTI